jgi:hypothetical protein
VADGSATDAPAQGSVAGGGGGCWGRTTAAARRRMGLEHDSGVEADKWAHIQIEG